LLNANAAYFADHLPHNQYWRFFPEFRESTAYLDIETTALDPWLHSITVITLYDGKQIFSYIQGKNLDDFAKDVQKYSVLVTYNGRRFHLPFMAMYMGLKLNQVHIDLRYILGSLGRARILAFADDGAHTCPGSIAGHLQHVLPPMTRGLSGSYPLWVARSKATESPFCPAARFCR
jgi:hypothetical protein